MTEIIETSLDSQGRLVIPSAIRNRLGLSKEVTLIVEDEGDNEIRLRIQKGSPILVDKKGIIVVKSESSSDLASIIQQERDRRRIKANAEKSAATDADIKNLSEEIMEDWWKKNKGNFGLT